MAIGNWGETVTGGGIPGGQGDCEDQDIWLMTAPPYNGPQTGFSAGNWDNVTVLEYNCVTNQYENPTGGTNQNTHKFALNENSDANGMDIADTDNDGVIDMVAIGQGWEQNVSYATAVLVASGPPTIMLESEISSQPMSRLMTSTETERWTSWSQPC